jgi:polyisoprenoid-binding protein YceI
MTVDAVAEASTDARRPRRFFARQHWRRWLIALVAFLAIAYFAVPWLYIHVFSEPAPPPLSFEQLDKERAGSSPAANSEATAAAPANATDALDGIWIVAAPSSAGYRVEESIAGQPKTAVGRTSTVDGTFTISGGQITAAEVNVDLASMVSDEPRRDAQFRGRIMATDEFPVATFTLTEPLAIPKNQSSVASVQVKGLLAMRGSERPAVFAISGRITGDSITLVAKTDIVFADYAIPNPSIGPVSTDDNGTIEVALTAKR